MDNSCKYKIGQIEIQVEFNGMTQFSMKLFFLFGENLALEFDRNSVEWFCNKRRFKEFFKVKAVKSSQIFSLIPRKKAYKKSQLIFPTPTALNNQLKLNFWLSVILKATGRCGKVCNLQKVLIFQ
jgi:hypothetical protein